MNTKTKI